MIGLEMQRIRAWARACALVVCLSSCLMYPVEDSPPPKVSIAENYSLTKISLDGQQDLNQPWWEAYHEKSLNRLVTTAFSSNYSFQSAWDRLRQAQAQYKASSSGKYPNVTLDSSAVRARMRSSNVDTQNSLYNSFSASSSLSYEVDLWRRVDAISGSGEANLEASRADFENTALILSGRITELWIRAQEQKRLLKLLRRQVRIGQTLLDLTRIRFQVGRGTALDVYQQRQQLDSTLAEIPIVKSYFHEILNELAVLTGKPPASIRGREIAGKFPALPPFPSLVSPALLLETRPDLRAIRSRVRGAQFNIASAIADQYPLLSTGLSYDFQAQEITDLFSNGIGQILSSVTLPLIDGGARAARVEEQKAYASEIKNIFTHAFLIAIQDVENAIIAERAQVKLLEVLNDQMTWAQATLRESRSRYLNGLTDYLQVIVALQALQGLERRLLSEQSTLLLTRNRLYLALGGRWTEKLSTGGGAS
jgi:NodT family efflux transporter outer membrane factor (OMF) lipoprotein